MKEVVIFSTEEDQSTSDVMDWLLRHETNTKVWRLNASPLHETENEFSFILNDAPEILFKSKGLNIISANITSVWYRKTKSYNNGYYRLAKLNDETFMDSLNSFINGESNYAKNILDIFINKNDNSLGNINVANINKMFALDKARKAGLLIPPTIITNSKKILKNFIEENGQVICKPIKDNIPLKNEDEPPVLFSFFTSAINENFLELLPNSFFVSLFQKRIEKEIEIRCFYIDSELYSMAIFSQTDETTKVDFRNYNQEVPNRTVPYQLPKVIETKIRHFMKSINLNTGSIDIILSTDNKYYFLEVNPAGQFHMVSRPCNYFIERRIANYLES